MHHSKCRDIISANTNGLLYFHVWTPPEYWPFGVAQVPGHGPNGLNRIRHASFGSFRVKDSTSTHSKLESRLCKALCRYQGPRVGAGRKRCGSYRAAMELGAGLVPGSMTNAKGTQRRRNVGTFDGYWRCNIKTWNSVPLKGDRTSCSIKLAIYLWN